jgi:formamidopyrimidine-DNA glycosylase
MVDEILYQARIHPARKATDLSSEELLELHSQIDLITRTAVEVDADWKKFPETWLFPHRWSKGKKKGAVPDFIMVGSYLKNSASLFTFHDCRIL